MCEISKTERLGNEECATILLTDGNASTNIQVNPFLDFMSVKEEKSWSGKVEVSRKVNMLRLATLLDYSKETHSYKQDSYFKRRELILKPRKGLKKKDELT